MDKKNAESYVRDLVTQLEKDGAKHAIIVAPHPDDEIIGCHLFLKAWQQEVSLWFCTTRDPGVPIEHDYRAAYDLPKVNVLFFCREEKGLDDEALKRAFKSQYCSYDDIVFLLPNPLDEHPLHKKVNILHDSVHYEAIGRGFGEGLSGIVYYSVSKNAPCSFALSEKEIREKRALLLEFYPNEKIWEKDEKFVIYESYNLRPGISTIWVTTSFEAFHCWPEAPCEVLYLRDLHRHIFQVKAEVEVYHGDRELEFHLFKAFVTRTTDYFLSLDIPSFSCEYVAEVIAQYIKMAYGYMRRVTVTVSEDGENGATVAL